MGIFWQIWYFDSRLPKLNKPLHVHVCGCSMAHGHKFAKLKSTHHQKFSNLAKCYSSKITSYICTCIQYLKSPFFSLPPFLFPNTLSPSFSLPPSLPLSLLPSLPPSLSPSLPPLLVCC